MPQSTTRSAADEIRKAVAAEIRNNFDYRNVRGLTENPTVTQNPTRQTTEPYIYVYSVGQVEIDSTKDDTPFQYHVAIEVTLRYNSYRGGQRQGEEILNEVLSYVRGKNASEYPDLTPYGFNVYNTTTGDTVELTDRLRGANYYKVVTALYVTASWTGQEVQVQPIQDPTFSYSGFSYSPTENRIERYDAGNIIPAQTYTSPNNGWIFTTVDYSLPASAEGVYDGTDYTLTATNEPVAIDSSINYMRPGGTPVTTHIVTDSTKFIVPTAETQVGEWAILTNQSPFPGIAPQEGDDWTTINDTIIAESNVPGNRLNDSVVVGDLVRFTWGAGSASFPVVSKSSRSVVLGNAQDIVGTIGRTFTNNESFTLEADIIVPVEIDTTLAATTSWDRIDSIRYGAIAASAGQQPTFSDDTAATYGLRLLSNWNIDYGVTSPQNVTITYTANKDEYTYIIVSQEVTLAGIRDSLGTNNINNFDVVTDGAYRYYISKNPILFDNSSFTFTLNE